MPKHRFSKSFNDENLNEALRQVEENFANASDLADKAIKTVRIDRIEPKLNGMSDGGECIYDDGSNAFLYRRAGGRLFKIQLTEVS